MGRADDSLGDGGGARARRQRPDRGQDARMAVHVEVASRTTTGHANGGGGGRRNDHAQA